MIPSMGKRLSISMQRAAGAVAFRGAVRLSAPGVRPFASDNLQKSGEPVKKDSKENFKLAPDGISKGHGADSKLAGASAKKELQAMYEGHAMTADNLVAQALKEGAKPPFDAMVWADPGSGKLSDQNHIGGLASTKRLMAMTGLRATDVVGDLGCGIGGSARVLEATHGCQVLGYDPNHQRVEDARRLSELVNHGKPPKYEVGDLAAFAAKGPVHDVAWAQSVLIHIGPPAEVIPLLARGAKRAVCVEELCLRRQPANEHERGLLDKLNAAWAGQGKQIYPLTDWQSALAGVDASRAPNIDVDTELADIAALHKEASAAGSPWPKQEVEAMAIALELQNAGVLGFFRGVATKATPAELAPAVASPQ
jgi:SAM-dependent methyltransferase